MLGDVLFPPWLQSALCTSSWGVGRYEERSHRSESFVSCLGHFLPCACVAGVGELMESYPRSLSLASRLGHLLPCACVAGVGVACVGHGDGLSHNFGFLETV